MSNRDVRGLGIRASWRVRALATALLVAGAGGLGVFGWREADRATRTQAILMRDYASFIADRFVRAAASAYARASGLNGAPPGAEGDAAFAVLQHHARVLEAGRAAALPVPTSSLARYFFAYEAARRKLEFAGAAPLRGEADRLKTTLEEHAPACGANQLVALGRLRAAPQRGADDIAWSVVLQTDQRGALRRAVGFRAAEQTVAQTLFAPLASQPIECDCPSNVIPASLASAGATNRAASFVLRDAAGRVVFRSEPAYPDATPVTQPLSSETPFPGWTLEVAVNPAVVRPLLPNGGEGAPAGLLALMAAAVLGSGLLAFFALHRDRQLWRARQDFVSNVTHELKTPLARIRLFNELLLADRQEDAEKRGHYRTVIDRECRRLTLLVERVLDFSRSERGGRRLQKEPVDLRRVVEEAIESLAADPSRVVTELRPVPMLAGDAQALQQVVSNLLDNALKYSPEDRPVAVSLMAGDAVVTLRVRDQGCGIPASERERIFDEFYRVESGDTQRASGTGLGLALVRRAVAAHGGRIEVESEVGRGSAFTVTLPLSLSGGVPAPSRLPA
jgi:signal transduction histidine kinase